MKTTVRFVISCAAIGLVNGASAHAAETPAANAKPNPPPAARAASAKPEVKPEPPIPTAAAPAKPEAKPEPKPEPKPAAKPEAPKPEVKPEAKPEAKPEVKPETKPEAPKPQPAKPQAAEPAPAKPATPPAKPAASDDDDNKSYRPRWTSPTYKAVIKGTEASSALPAWHGNHFWNAKVRDEVVPQLNGWTEHLYNVIAKDGDNLVSTVPKNIQYFCPNFKSLDREHRIVFWARLISVMSSYESSFNPKTTYLESGIKVLSSGLMQISHASAQEPKYECSMINEDKEEGQKDLFDPKKNLSCAVHIINYWVGHDGAMVEFANNDNGVKDDEYWKGLSRYWGVFRHKRIKEDPDMYWEEIKTRLTRWQEAGAKRDELLLQRLRQANDSDDSWTNRDWEAQGSYAPHPSLLEDKYDDEEAHPLTSILRQINQTSFCYSQPTSK